MHMVIRAIVYAKNEEEALDNARSTFESLVNANTFDYYQMFDDEGTPVSGKGRWGEIPAVALATSKEGKKLIEDGIKYTEDEFDYAFRGIKESIDKPRAELVADIGSFRYWCYIIGQYSGSSVFLYDNDGCGIRSRDTLDKVLNKWDSEEYKDLDVYVVPADVHH